MKKKDTWKDVEKGKEEDYFLKKHREWLEKKQRSKDEKEGGNGAGPDLPCPRCKKPLTEDASLQSIVYRCESCGGGWLDQSSLKALLETAE